LRVEARNPGHRTFCGGCRVGAIVTAVKGVIRGVRRSIAPALLAMAALGVAAPSAGATTVTLGTLDLSPTANGTTCNNAQGCTYVQTQLPEAGTLLRVPTDGIVNAWRVRSPQPASVISLRVLRPAGGQFTGAGTSAAAVYLDGVTPNPANLAVQAGDQIGVNLGLNSEIRLRSVANASFGTFTPALADNSAGTPAPFPGGYVLQFNATVQLTPPTVSGVNLTAPDSGTVTISGAHLAGATQVLFGDAPAVGFSIDSNTQITATVPTGPTGTVDVTVTTPAGVSQTSAADRYTFPGGGGGGGGTDTTAPTATLGGRATQDIDKLSLTVGSDEAAALSGSATVNLPAVQKRLVRSRAASTDVAAGQTAKLRFRFARKTLRAVKRALADGKHLKAKITVTATDASGNASTATKTVKLRD
jgi:IPT/TIG domain